MTAGKAERIKDSMRHAEGASPPDAKSRVSRTTQPGGDQPGGVVSPRFDAPHEKTLSAGSVPFPTVLTEAEFYRAAYPLMYRSRRLDQRLLEMFQRRQVRGTVTSGEGTEATTVGVTLPLRPGKDVVSLLHRDLAGHLIMGSDPYKIVCQYMANAESPTRGLEGNVHYGDAPRRRFPMMSHLGIMLSLVVGGTWQARRRGDDAFGLAVIGDGGTSTGDFHESLNIASVHRVPVLFLVQNNRYAFSTPVELQYNCERLSDRAVGYGIPGKTIDGLDAWQVYSTVCEALRRMSEEPGPLLLECMCLRMHGHAAYDKAEYVPAQWKEEMKRQDPVAAARRRLCEVTPLDADDVTALEGEINEEIERAISRAQKVGRPQPRSRRVPTYARPRHATVRPFKAKGLKNGAAVNQALDYLLRHEGDAFLMGLDIGTYGSAFKTCKGLIDRHGADRVMDMPLGESGIVGFALGASQVGGRPIVEFQFADFATESATQIGLNCGTWYFRSHNPAPLLMRLPCGGGLTMGAFHSGEFEGLWSAFPGLKLLYPATAQETFEALVAGYYDDNPCLVLEHKLLYWSRSGDVDFDGDLQSVWKARKYRDGADATVVATGSMVHEALAAAQQSRRSLEVINPFVLHPLELGPVCRSVEKTGRLLVVQESGETQGMGDRIISRVVRECYSALKAPPRLVAAPDQPVPFAGEYEVLHRPHANVILTELDHLFGAHRCPTSSSGSS